MNPNAYSAPSPKVESAIEGSDPSSKKWRALFLLLPFGVFFGFGAIHLYFSRVRDPSAHFDQLSHDVALYVVVRMVTAGLIGFFILASGAMLGFNIQQAATMTRVAGILLGAWGIIFNLVGYFFTLADQRGGLVGVIASCLLNVVFLLAFYLLGNWLVRLDRNSRSRSSLL